MKLDIKRLGDITIDLCEPDHLEQGWRGEKSQCLGSKIRRTEGLIHGKRAGKEKGKLLRTDRWLTAREKCTRGREGWDRWQGTQVP